MQYHSNTGEGSLSVFLQGLVQRNLDGVLAANQPELPSEPVKLVGNVEGLASSAKEKYIMTAEREQIILSLLQYVEPLLHKHARAWHLDFDDLYQEASIQIMKLLNEDLAKFRDLRAVASYCVRIRVIQIWRYTRSREMQSLDAPLSAENGVTLADLLPSPYSADPATVVLTRERLENLETSVRHMTGTHGVAVRSRYETALATYC
jgi:DNA-directed RNA polymerase specialized sigma24 family protein